MDARLELEGYEVQIKEIEETLRVDPGNAELIELRAELETLVDLLRKSLGPSASTSSSVPASASTSKAQQPASASSTSASTSSNNPYASTSSSSGNPNKPAQSFTAGTEVLAKWHKDHKFYPARVTSVSGSASDPVYTVIFDVDKSTEVVRGNDVKALKENKKRSYATLVENDDRSGSTSAPSSSSSKKSSSAADKEKGEKKAVKEEERKARVAQQNKAQSSWQSFAKKGAKKGINIPGMTGESQFRSPDNPYGRVGVVGSGKGMTSYEQKKRAKFEEGGDA